MNRIRDEGSVTLFFCLSVTGLFALLGLIVDGGAKVRSLERADRLAEEAGRAGGQAINVPVAVSGNAPVVDVSLATRTVQSFLAQQGATGSVRVIDGGRSLVVDVTTSSPTVFLGLVGINSFTVHGSAQVTLVRGITGANQ